MKIVLTTTNPNIESEVDPRFGRGAYLLVVDSETLEWEAHANPGVNASGGAGIQAAQFAADKHAEAVISGDFGPNAHNALQEAKIGMYIYGDCRTAQEAISRFKDGLLQQIGSPTRNDCHHDTHV
jgi:predicted Fe-Mo cluster-binding NifX family protein